MGPSDVSCVPWRTHISVGVPWSSQQGCSRSVRDTSLHRRSKHKRRSTYTFCTAESRNLCYASEERGHFSVSRGSQMLDALSLSSNPFPQPPLWLSEEVQDPSPHSLIRLGTTMSQDDPGCCCPFLPSSSLGQATGSSSLRRLEAVGGQGPGDSHSVTKHAGRRMVSGPTVKRMHERLHRQRVLLP